MNRALRRLVATEEDARREKRQKLQKILKQRIADAAVAAAAGSSSAAVPIVSTSTSVEEAAPLPTQQEAEEEYEDEVIEQQKLLASATAQWRCVEDSQQAVCIATNRRQTLIAVGEKDGRISIWDNTTIRVITKELDPTSIVLPTSSDETVGKTDTTDERKVATQRADVDEGKQARDEEMDNAARPSKRAKMSDDGASAQGGQDDQEGSVDGEDSATNEDASVDGNDDGSVEAEEDDMVATAMDVDDNGSIEDTGSVDENGVDDQGDGDEEDGATGSTDTVTDSLPPAPPPRKISDGSIPGLSLEELKIAKSMLKHVVSIAWSCDSSLVFAGCEEKSTRRGRLCVWDAESAWLLATFSFDAAVNALHAHPTNPDLVIVCSYNSQPVLLNVRTREMTELAVPIMNSSLTVTPPPNSRQPSLVVNCRYGLSGRFIYCATSKSTVAILDSATLSCVDVKYLSILVQFVDIAINAQETALLITSSKGIHEFEIQRVEGDDTKPRLQETRLHATGAVRAPWALCCFSSDGGYVVGMPIVRHRHVGESGLYTWHRGTGRVQHNLGVKDGVNSISWDVRRDAILVVSCSGAIHVLEEDFKTEWPGTMYPAGFRLLTDNELDMTEIEKEFEEKEESKTNDPIERDAETLANGESAADQLVDIFSLPVEDEECEISLPAVESERRYIPSIPITQHLKRHHQHDFHIERHFGLGQSVFEPLKSAIKKPSSGSSSKKKKKSSSATGPSSTQDSQEKASSKSKSKSSSSKKRRR